MSVSNTSGSKVSFFLPFGSHNRCHGPTSKEPQQQNIGQTHPEHPGQPEQQEQQEQEAQHWPQDSTKDQRPPSSCPKQPRHPSAPSESFTLDLLTEYRQVEQYIQRLHEAFRTALASRISSKSYHDDTSILARSNEFFGDPDLFRPSDSSINVTRPSGDRRVALCHISPDLFGEDPIQIPLPPASLRLLEYRCEFEGVAIAREVVKRRNELWAMIQQMERERERREFEERMLRLRLELEKETAIELRQLDRRLSSS
ncbi:hypothetical protein B0O80DRAFT_421754 [Mortierella sp. GBAus27b]|nr:hypothetical protein B0O80DRAFT_421754 [Mortierella sp. GBAus27b]